MVAFVGLTGGVGAGKSTALDALERLGVPTLSTDAVVHELYRSAELRDEIRARWGGEVIAADGTVDRAAVARRAFTSDDERHWLEGTLWPRVGERVAAWRDEVARREAPPSIAVVEAPLLFESFLEDAYDATIAVVADEETRARRAEGRGHEAVDERVARQLPQDEKARRATHVVANDGTVDDLRRELSAVLEKLRG
ncbi:dephospho-CoA kinase [soil metagenome]